MKIQLLMASMADDDPPFRDPTSWLDFAQNAACLAAVCFVVWAVVKYGRDLL